MDIKCLINSNFNQNEMTGLKNYKNESKYLGKGGKVL